MVETLVNALIEVATNCDELADEALAHADKILAEPITDRDVSVGIEIYSRYIDRLGEILETVIDNSEIEYNPMSV